MIEVQPTLLRIQAWDATKGTNVYFTYTGSRQAMENNLLISDAETGYNVYSHEYSSYERVHPIPPNVLQNGKTYKAKIRVKFGDGTFSPYSAELQFKTFKTPVIDISNLDGSGYVYNNDVTFIASYTQDDGELVKSYRFTLYDENQDLVETFPIRAPKSDSPNYFTETTKGLTKGKGYFIECSIETVNGFTYTHTEHFIPMYIVPSINGVVTTRNDNEDGFVRVTANLKQVIGTQVAGSSEVALGENLQSTNPYEYVADGEGDWIIVPQDNPVLFRGLGMNRASDFVMKVWCRNIPNGKKFLDLNTKDGTGIPIEFWKYEDRVVAVKKFGGITSKHRSNILSIPSGTSFLLYVKTIEHRIELTIQLL